MVQEGAGYLVSCAYLRCFELTTTAVFFDRNMLVLEFKFLQSYYVPTSYHIGNRIILHIMGRYSCKAFACFVHSGSYLLRIPFSQ